MSRRNRLIKSFGHAYTGIVHALATQRNLRIHWCIAMLTLTATIVWNVSITDILAVFLSIGLVIGLEMVNTAVETTVDLVTSDYHPLAKIAKDVGAGAVLIAAICTFLIGILIFSTPVFANRFRTFDMILRQPLPVCLAALGLLFLMTTFIISLRYQGSKRI
jgi:diacylglycerol kinase (ATP)